MQSPRQTPSLRVAGAAFVGMLGGLSTPAQFYPSPAPIAADARFQSNGLPDRSTENTINRISLLTSEQLRISQIAAARATRRQVRSFAEELQNSSQDLQREIDRMAQAKSILVPTGKSSDEVAEEERNWRDTEAREIDGHYVNRVTRLHKDAIDALEASANDKDMDPEVVTFANRHLPALREHLRQAEELKKLVDEQ